MKPVLKSLALAGLVATASIAPVSPSHARLTAEDRADLGRIQVKVNSFKSLSTRFRQISPRGRVSLGTIYIQRPGKLRIQFDKRKLLILTSRLWLIVIQGRRGKAQHFPLNSTPAGILVRSKVTFGGDIRVIGVRRNEERIFVTIVRRKTPKQGRMTMIFDKEDLSLLGWNIIDSQGLLTRVLLTNTKLDVPLNPNLFAVPQGRVRSGGVGSDR